MDKVKNSIHNAAVYMGIISEPNRSTPEEIVHQSVKMIDVGYIFVIYFVCAIGLAMLVDKIFGTFKPENYNKESNLRITLELLLSIMIFGILCYMMRELINIIPYPLNNVEGHAHKDMKELSSPWIFGVVFFFSCSNMSDRVKHFYKRLF